jgi:diguanylate cyclase (GGDEF)-like protein
MFTMSLGKTWERFLDSVDYAFQPIVNIYTGKTFAFEALIRDYEKAGFSSIDAVFDTAYNENILYSLDLELRRIAIRKFSQIPFSKNVKLFYNIDNRTTIMPDFKPGHTKGILREFELFDTALCFELSEKHQSKISVGVDNLILNIYKQQGYRMAIDDFGVGYSGLQILYNAEPDFLKIDRFFVDNISQNKKKQLFVKSIVEISQSLGIQTIAEGIETKEDLITCKTLGCNMVQGFFVQKPTKKIVKLQEQYLEIDQLHKSEQRGDNSFRNELKNRIEPLEYVQEISHLEEVFNIFKHTEQSSIVPVLRADKSCVGIIKESGLKEYTYSPYGRSLIFNITKGAITSLILECGTVDINDSLEKILKTYANKQNSDGVLVTKNGKYLGFLNARTLLDIVNEKSVLSARDQNPLTGLPGNIVINEYISSATVSNKKHALVYFDLDFFKPFNDYYGFRNGDRVIKLLGTLIKRALNNLPQTSVAGHIGGDDFFLGWEMEKEATFEDVYKVIDNIINKFNVDVESFYNKEDRERGYIISKNREGKEQKFHLMTVSASILVINPASRKTVDEEKIALEYAKLKKHAKSINANAIVFASIVGN